MRAVRLHELGAPPRLDEIPAPDPPAAGRLLVEVAAGGVGSWDVGVASGRLARFVGQPLPYVLGAELVGRVAAVGAGVTGFTLGDRVMGNPGIVGAWAQAVTVDAAVCGRAPASLDDVETAAVPVGAVTALQALRPLGLEDGHTLLILGAGGSVGRAAIQLAAARGAIVLATVPAWESARSEALGAAHAVDQEDDWSTKLQPHVGAGVDAVLDLVGGATLERSLALLQSGSRAVTTLAESVERARELGLAIDYLRMRSTTADLDAVAALIDAGDLTMPLGTVRPLDEVAAALQDVGDPRHKGKVVLRF
ncbi:MAG: NADP-dependent oxidoreductase [Candidatus Limnocylindrales bacterium]